MRTALSWWNSAKIQAPTVCSALHLHSNNDQQCLPFRGKICNTEKRNRKLWKRSFFLARQQNTLIRHTYVIAQIHMQWPFWCKRANTTRKCTLQPDFTLPNGDVTIVSHTAVNSYKVHWNYPGCECYCPHYCSSQHCHSFYSKDKAWHGKRQIMDTENHQKVDKTEAHESASWNAL